MPDHADPMQRIEEILRGHDRSATPPDDASSQGSSRSAPLTIDREVTATLTRAMYEFLASGESLDMREISERFPEHADRLQEVIESIGLGESGGSGGGAMATGGAEGQDGPTVSLPAAATAAPLEFGRYRVTNVIGSGGFGIVYRAWDEPLQRPVAIKVSRRLPDRQATPSAESGSRPGAGEPDSVAEELAEARFLAGLDHPRIVPVYDVGQMPDGSLYVVSKFIDGQDLGRRLRTARLSFRDSARILAEVADALDYAHQQGVVHRDIKPGNILLTSDDRPVLVDFGLAVRESDLGGGGSFGGTPAYMSPEQARQEGHRLDGRTDIYSLGAVLYRLLTGSRPFEATTISALLAMVRNVEVRPPRQLDPKIPRELERICLRALSKRVSDRYRRASEMAEDLRHWLAESGGGKLATKPAGRSADSTEASHSASHRSTRTPSIVPRGLRRFDAADSDFFLELLPGARDRDGLPECIRFWKSRIEQAEAETTFGVGVLLGPSGSGKSSLVHAGLLPRLSEQVLAITVDSRPHELEARVLRRLARSIPQFESVGSLREALRIVRRGQGLAAGCKLLLVFDQFEQYLNYHAAAESSELVEALRQCDGVRVQALLLIRDDFTLAATQFMDRIEEPLSQARNFDTVEPFGREHAERVLRAFGQAFGALPDGALPKEQSRFLEAAIDGLAEAGPLMPIQLALFAEMVKDKPWTLATLRAYGGTRGIGAAFLEEKLNGASAHPFLRTHAELTRELLALLLPADESVIRGPARTRAELVEHFARTARPDTLDRVLDLLDTELRLLTPSGFDATASVDSLSQVREPAYQLAHDYLVPTLRDWLTAVERTTRRGRVLVHLRELSDAWNARPEPRRLPTTIEWLNICCWTRPRQWSAAQRRMMKAATSRFVQRTAVIAGMLIVLAIAGYWSHGWQRARALRERLLNADTAETPLIVKEMRPYRNWIDPLLRRDLAASDAIADRETNEREFRRRLHLQLAMLESDPEQWSEMETVLPLLEPEELGVTARLIGPHVDRVTPSLWEGLRQGLADDSESALACAAVLARLHHIQPNPRNNSAWAEIAMPLAQRLVRIRPFQLPEWIDHFLPVREHLAPALLSMLKVPPTPDLADDSSTRDRQPTSPTQPAGPTQPTGPTQLTSSERSNLVDLLTRYAAERPEQLASLLAEATPEEVPRVMKPLKVAGRDAATAVRRELIQASRLGHEGTSDDQRPTEEIVRLEESYEGVADNRGLLVQAVPRDRFDSLVDQLRRGGYQPTSIRPYWREGKLLVAASWIRGRAEFHWQDDLDEHQLQQLDATSNGEGLRLADIAWYPVEKSSASPDSESDSPAATPGRFAGLWIARGPEAADVRVQWGVSLAAQREAEDKWSAEGHTLQRLLVRHESPAEPRCWAIWVRPADGESLSSFSRFRYAGMFGDLYPGHLQTDCRMWSLPSGKRDTFGLQDRLSDIDVSPSASQRALAAKWNRILGRHDVALQWIDALAKELPTNATVRYFRAEVLAAAGRRDELVEEIARHQQAQGRGYRQRLLEFHAAILDDNLDAARRAAYQVEEEAGTDRESEAALAASRALARLATLEPEPQQASRLRQRAVHWLRTAIVDRGLDCPDCETQQSELVALRQETDFRRLLAERAFDLRYAGTWCVSTRYQSRTCLDLDPTSHLAASRNLFREGFTPQSIDVHWQPERAEMVAASVWHRRVLPPESRSRKARTIATLAIALAALEEYEYLWDVLGDHYDREARCWTIEQLPSSDVPSAILVDRLRMVNAPDPRRNLLLALGGYPKDRFSAEDREYLASRLSRMAFTSDHAGLQAAAAWCARQWQVPLTPPVSLTPNTSQPANSQRANSQRAAWRENSLGQVMVVIRPPREILIGAPFDEPDRERTEQQQWVRIPRAYALAATETTVEQFRQFLADPRVKKFYAARQDFTFTQQYAPTSDCPQISARWFDAARFCQWLSERENIPEDQWCFPGIWESDGRSFPLPENYLQRTGYRPPTEAEWEFACRANSPAARSFGESPALLGAYAWHRSPASQPVGLLKPNDFGLFDMLGNASEWCLDAYQHYRTPLDDYARDDREDESRNVLADSFRVVRGGFYGSSPASLRSANRSRTVASANVPQIGFRVARTWRD